MFRTNLTPEKFNEIYGNEIKLDNEISGIVNEIITEIITEIKDIQ
jgi:hypothetical protein